MLVLHCILKSEWENVKNNLTYSPKSIENQGFIHCSDIDTFYRVAPNFKHIPAEDLVLLSIDTEKLKSKIVWEDLDHVGTQYPHIYGELNIDAVVDVFPFIRDENDVFVLNSELTIQNSKFKIQNYIDTHAHCYVSQMKDNKSVWLERMDTNHIFKVLLPNIDVASIEDMHKLCDEFPDRFHPMMGLHPCDIKENYKQDLEICYQYLSKNPEKYCGVGEIGLDYHWDLRYQVEQKIALETQFEWALEFNKSVSIHSRKSNHDMIPLITKWSKKGLKGVMHCFSGSIQEAHQIVDAGFYLGVGGVLTYPKSGLQEVIKEIDLNHIVLETDSPYLAPVPHRGKPNEPSYIYDIAYCLANLKEVSLNDVAEKTTENARRVFDI